MNQILQTETKKNKGPIEIKKIVIFFAIAIIVFAVILVGLGSYFIIQQKNKEKENQIIQEQNQIPDVQIDRQDDNIIISVTHNVPISKITYKWNNEEEKQIETDNQTSITQELELPFGTNTLNLIVTDSNGKETNFQKEYVVDGNGKPVINLKLTNNNKIKITVQDTSGLSQMLYSWNNEEAIKVEANAENSGIIEQEVEIPFGQNTLKVQAINTNNITTTKELEVKGVKNPVVTFQKEGDFLVIRAEDESGMKVINYTLNGQKYQINYGNKKVIEYKQKLEKGENNLELTAENQDGGITTKKVKCFNT